MSDFVSADHVFLNNPATSIEDVLTFLSAKAVELGVAADEAAVLAAFHEREAMGTTGMSDGFAIPHAKSEAVSDAAVIVVKLANEITDWGSMDGKPIRMVVALLVPGGEAGTTHLQLLSKTAVMLMNDAVCERLMAAEDAAAIAAEVNAALA